MKSLNDDSDKGPQSSSGKRQKQDSLIEGDVSDESDVIDSDKSVESDAEDISPSFYRGFHLDAKAIVKKVGTNVLSLFTERSRTVTAKNAREILFIKCLISCSEHD